MAIVAQVSYVAHGPFFKFLPFMPTFYYQIISASEDVLKREGHLCNSSKNKF